MSEMLRGAARRQDGYFNLVADGTLQKRVADPAEIVGPVLYPASDASSFVTADDLSVSGGMMKQNIQPLTCTGPGVKAASPVLWSGRATATSRRGRRRPTVG
jgi:hypothetical protein